MSDDKKEEIARLKGEYEALESVAVRKSCSFVAELGGGPKRVSQRQRQQQVQVFNCNKWLCSYLLSCDSTSRSHFSSSDKR